MGFFSKLSNVFKTKQEITENIDFQEKPSSSSELSWKKEAREALNNSEPKLSIWLEYLLKGIKQKDDKLWERLRFLFEELNVASDETDKFITGFSAWLDSMEYKYIEEFRSELQYRLALALDLEDEEDEHNRLLIKLSSSLQKTREQLSRQIENLLNSNSKFDEEFWQELEEILIIADVGFQASQELLKRLRPKVKAQKEMNTAIFKGLLKEELINVFPAIPEEKQYPKPEVVLVVGVNGAGKTTTIAKLAYRAQMQNKKVLLAAGDTFRAAAIEQLEVWAKRIGVGFFSKPHGSDPAAVAYEALEIAIKENYDIVFVDTAGRLQTKVGLMDELGKIYRVITKKIETAPHRTLLVLDATTGQNAMSQAKLFSETAHISEIILTKLDGTAKGGVVVGIALEHNIPITFIGLGEKMEDLRPFNGQDFANALFE